MNNSRCVFVQEPESKMTIPVCFIKQLTGDDTMGHKMPLFVNISKFPEATCLSYNGNEYLISKGQVNHGRLIHNISGVKQININHVMRVIITNGVITSVSECDY